MRRIRPSEQLGNVRGQLASTEKSNNILTRTHLDCLPHLFVGVISNMEAIVAIVTLLLIVVTWLLFKLAASLESRR